MGDPRDRERSGEVVVAAVAVVVVVVVVIVVVVVVDGLQTYRARRICTC